MTIRDYRDNVIIRKRMLFSFFLLFVIFFCLVGRLSYLMIYKSSYLKKIAVGQWTSKVVIDAKRGKILDRNGKELAVSGDVYRVDLDMNTLRDTMKEKGLNEETVANELGRALNMESTQVLKILKTTLPGGLPLASAKLTRRIEKDAADRVRALNLEGVLISEDTKRYYPNNNFLAQVLGHTNSDGEGLTGVELQYNKELSGTPGVMITETDKKSKEQPYTISEYTKPIDGKDVVLTIDEQIQSFCEKAAVQAITVNKAKAATIIAMDPKTGEILGLANKPDYNPNDPWIKGMSYDELQKSWRNRAVSDTFEPGSIFKVFTAAASLSEGLVKEDDRFVCNGSITVGKRVIHCWKRTGHGVENFVDIIKNSCNVGFAELGRRLGAEKLISYVRKFGFGQKTGVDLPGEAKGIVKNAANVTEVDLATISFGQTNTVSPIQYLAAFNSVANNGVWLRPHILKDIAYYDTNTSKEIYDKTYNNLGEKRIIDENVAKQLRGYLEKVISEGGGKKAYIEGYHIAGKTGTAQKVIGGVYAPQKYISSFAGMAPAEDPRITILVSIDEPDPSNYYAGQIATPIAKQLFNDIFNYMNIKVDASEEEVKNSMKKDVIIPEIRGEKKADALKILKDQHLDFDIDSNGDYIIGVSPLPGYSVKEGSKIILYTGTSANYNKVVIVPDVVGLSKTKALELLNNLGLKGICSSDGMVTEQDIEPGKQVTKGSTITLTTDPLGD